MFNRLRASWPKGYQLLRIFLPLGIYRAGRFWACKRQNIAIKSQYYQHHNKSKWLDLNS